MITIEQAKAISGKSPTLIRRAMREGKITGEKITSRMWLVDEASLREWMNTPRQRGNPNWTRRNMNQQQAVKTLKYYARLKRDASKSNMDFMPDQHATAEIREAKQVIDASPKTRAELVGKETARLMWREDE